MTISLTRTAALSFFLSLLLGSAFGQITGPTTVYVGTTTQYSFDDGSIEIGTFWTIVKGTVVSSWNTGTTYYATVNWHATGSGSVKFSAFDGQLDFLPVTVSTCSITAPTPPSSGTSRCGAGPFTLVATPGSGGTSIKWYAASTGGTAVYTGTSYPTGSISSSTTYYITTYNTTTFCESSPRTAVALTVAYTGTLSPSSASTFTNYSGLLSLSGSTGTILRWEKNVNSGGWTTISNTVSTYTYTVGPVSSNSITLLRAVLNNACGNPSYSTQSTINVYAPPQVLANGAAPSGSTVYNNYGYGVTLSIPGAYYTSYQWRRDGVDISGATSSSHVPALGGLYDIRVTVAGGATSTSTGVTVLQPNMQGDSVNMISKTVFFESGVTTATARYSMQPNDLAQVFAYTDGTGRIVQKVAVGQSPMGGDIVVPSVFGKNGTLDSVFLPYSTSSVKGRFRPNAIRGSTAVSSYSTGEQYSAYQNTPKVATDSKPYAVSLFQNTPESRVKEQGLPGNAWQPGSTRTVRSQRTLSTSGADPVLRWKADATTTGYYPNNTVWVERVTDENGEQTRIFTDKRGLTVLKKVQANAGPNPTLWLQTYYVYDDYGQLIMEIPPRAMDVLGSGTTLDAKVSTVAELVFKYTYDARGRLIQKKVPGSAAENIVYDKLDRVVLTQDGYQKTQNLWMFVKYDYKNRPVYSGTMSSSSDRITLQGQFDALDYSTQPYFEVPAINATYQGYTNTVFPTTSLTVLQAFYYDDYDFDANVTPDYSYDNAHLAGIPSLASTATRGLPTGSKRRILGSSNWLIKCIFYDGLDRPIQLREHNHLSLTTQDKTSILYVANSLSSTVDQIKISHVDAAGTTNVIQRYTYDNSWRTTAVYHKINTGSEIKVAQYEYNALGQVVAKKLHYTGSAFLQTVDMRYNIRGWLTSINNAKLVDDSGVTNNDTNDYFGMELFYNAAESSGLANTARYDGSISAVKWKNAGSTSGATGQRSYKFSYDYSDRLLSATFQGYSGTAWNVETNTLDETMTYESNGNILSLVRNKNQRGLSSTTVTATAAAVDNLSYTYFTGNENRLKKVTDASGNSEGFNDGASTTTEYWYDAHGSMGSDGNKGIDTVQYNHLGKPTQMTFTNGSTVVYTYDAAGTRLMTATTVSGVTTTTDYAAGFVYTNGNMSYFSSPEGRVVKNGANYEYQYAISDHQGNTRVVFSSVTPAPTAITATFEGDANDQQAQFLSVNQTHVVPSTPANHTPGGIKTIRMNQTYSAGPSWNKKVYAGDKVDMEVYAYYEPTSGWSSSNQLASTMITAIAGAFGGISGGGGESGSIFAGVNSALTNFGLGPNQGDNSPSAFLNYILFDENYKVMDMGWTAVPETANFAKQKLTIPTVTAKEAGYIFVYLSYEGLSNTYVYFDDFKVTFTPTNILQSNEYYPFGMQAATSWTRENAVANSFLANGGTELNNTTGLYDLEFRNYDPILGRLNQVDPFASKYSSLSPYNFAFNDPAYWNDPSGADVLWGLYTREQYESATTRREGSYNRGEYGGDYSPEAMAQQQVNGGGGWYKTTSTYLNTYNCPTCPNGKRYTLTEEVEYKYVEPTEGSGTELNWLSTAGGVLTIFGIGTDIAIKGPRPSMTGPLEWADQVKSGVKFARFLSVLGLLVTGTEVAYKGRASTANALDAYFGAVSLGGTPGAIIGGAYFLGNGVTWLVTEKTIGEHVDEKVWILPGVVGGAPILLIPKN